MNKQINIDPIPAFTDNYIWLVFNPKVKHALVVDPGDAQVTLNALDQRGLELGAVLITHHHSDHIGGLGGLLSRYPNALVYGPTREKIPHCTHRVKEGDEVEFADLGLKYSVLEVPGHTHGHIAYYQPEFKHLFCGDTLFVTGCGRVFSGSHAQLFHSLQRIAGLPADTKLYCAHEYTLDNIGFAQWVDKSNPDLMEFERQCRERRAQQIPTVPTTVATELRCNPFLRIEQESVQAAARKWARNTKCRYPELTLDEPAHIFQLLRNYKDVAYD